MSNQKRPQDKIIVNPSYRKITNQLKKEKKTKIQSKFFNLIEQLTEKPIDELPQLSKKQQRYLAQINTYQTEENQLLAQRAKHPPKITVQQMPADKRYNRLKTESKLLMNTLMMICYQAETAVAEILADHLKRAKQEKRMLVKQIINNTVDLEPDYENETLTVRLHSLSAPRYNDAAKKLTELHNQTDTIFPNSNLKMRFETTF